MLVGRQRQAAYRIRQVEYQVDWRPWMPGLTLDGQVLRLNELSSRWKRYGSTVVCRGIR